MKENPGSDEKFWETMVDFMATRNLIIDRPKNLPHPRYHQMIYPFDYGYLEGTIAADGSGIDVWVGSLPQKALTGCPLHLRHPQEQRRTQTAGRMQPNRCPSHSQLPWRANALPVHPQAGGKMKTIPEQYHDLLKNETRAFLFLATTMKDGSPQVTPIWFNHDDEHILINSAKGRVKDRNMRARARVAFVIQDPANPYRYIQVRGRVVEITEEGGLEHIKALAQKYTGKPWRGNSPDEVRVIYKILPEKTDAH